MAGNTSLMAVNVLAGKGIMSESLIGGITALPEGKSRQLSELIRVATE
jgi:cysteine synthase A/cysteine synthase B